MKFLLQIWDAYWMERKEKLEFLNSYAANVFKADLKINLGNKWHNLICSVSLVEQNAYIQSLTAM